MGSGRRPIIGRARYFSVIEASTVWHLPEPGSLVWRSFDSYSLLFNERSGDTHVLDPLSREILDLLMEAPHDETSLVRELSSLMEGQDPAKLEAAIHETLEAFDSAGLIIPAYFS
ncbi:HPr-rel-A system PqqD family peptide chaperone [Pelagibius sp. Alg239-R121]|uniref:HPr-rel-A system PqqD family peptide chaperone n=1 Tax=Pelagibius sp. Alg239-R121 TaxID=2993448 RepID=UPI0024A67CAD|nr:HPr-rel-A system PqqD family peptide chaperone [Pelagibius sp. Alg239-R121]